MKKLSKKTCIFIAVLFGVIGVSACSAENKSAAEGVVAKAKAEISKLEDVAEKDFDKAFADAKKEGKVLMLEFTGSQWCPPCKMLHKYVLNTEQFLKYAKDKLKVVVADYGLDRLPVEKAQADNYNKLAQKYELTGFPTIILIEPRTGKTEKYVGLQFQTPSALIEKAESIKK